jgi:redox-sensitive bicupin YhaK (pirin superfamily)
LLVDLELDKGATIELPDVPERGLLIVSGEVRVGELTLTSNRLAVLARQPRTQLTATEPSRALVIGGPPMGKRLIDWNFVASTQDRIDRARAAWKAQTFPKIPTDQDEHVPYPDVRR